jgi:hypothetical protein
VWWLQWVFLLFQKEAVSHPKSLQNWWKISVKGWDQVHRAQQSLWQTKEPHGSLVVFPLTIHPATHQTIPLRGPKGFNVEHPCPRCCDHDLSNSWDAGWDCNWGGRIENCSQADSSTLKVHFPWSRSKSHKPEAFFLSSLMWLASEDIQHTSPNLSDSKRGPFTESL